MPIVNADAAPVSTVMDETYKIGITRFSDWIRVGGTGWLQPAPAGAAAGDLGALGYGPVPAGRERQAGQLLDRLAANDAHDTPVVGAIRYRNLYTNTGHGTLRWNMACGSRRTLADLISGRLPEVCHKDLAADRHRNEWRFQAA